MALGRDEASLCIPHPPILRGLDPPGSGPPLRLCIPTKLGSHSIKTLYLQAQSGQGMCCSRRVLCSGSGGCKDGEALSPTLRCPISIQAAAAEGQSSMCPKSSGCGPCSPGVCLLEKKQAVWFWGPRPTVVWEQLHGTGSQTRGTGAHSLSSLVVVILGVAGSSPVGSLWPRMNTEQHQEGSGAEHCVSPQPPVGTDRDPCPFHAL